MKDIVAAAKWISSKMNFAIMAEAVSWPSPGLVSPIDSGCHKDMDIYTFINSSIALSDYFKIAAEKGIQMASHSNLSDLFPVLQRLGLEAEADMFAFTKGVNTHKGMVFHGLLLCAAAGIAYVRNGNFVPEQICSYTQKIVADELTKQLENAKSMSCDRITTGLKAYCKFGIKGIRGEALGGYKNVLKSGLPALRDAINRRATMREAIIHTLLALMARTEDTTLLNRQFDFRRITYVRTYAKKVLECGSIFTIEGWKLLEQMCKDFNNRQLSPGGAADLTCVTLALNLWNSKYQRGDLYKFE